MWKLLSLLYESGKKQSSKEMQTCNSLKDFWYREDNHCDIKSTTVYEQDINTEIYVQILRCFSRRRKKDSNKLQ